MWGYTLMNDRLTLPRARSERECEELSGLQAKPTEIAEKLTNDTEENYNQINVRANHRLFAAIKSQSDFRTNLLSISSHTTAKIPAIFPEFHNLFFLISVYR